MASSALRQLSTGRWFTQTAILSGILIASLGVALMTFKFGSKLRHASYDCLFALRPTVSITNAFVVYLDEQSHFELKQPLNAAWNRELHARLIDRLTRAGARAIIFDIVFLDSGNGETAADRALINAAKASGRVIVGANPRRDPGQVEPAADLPFDALRDAIDERWGLVEMVPDSDQVVRRMPPSYPPFKHSLPWITAQFLGAPVTQATNEALAELSERSERWLNYYGPGNWLPSASFADALDPQRMPDTVFRDRIVFVGSSTLTKFSAERKDSYRTPFSDFTLRSAEQFIAGVEIQATATLNLLRGDWLKRIPETWELFITVALGAAVGVGFVAFKPLTATVAFLALEATLVGTVIVVFRDALVWSSWLVWGIQIGAAYFYSITANSLRLYVQNQLLEQTVASYVGRKLAKKYVREQNLDFLRPGARKQELTIFFSDIAGFTSISEGMDSSALAMHMNQYFEGAVGKCIQATDGTVVKYIGDAIFAFWNAPDPQSDHAERACEAALKFREQPHREMNGQPLITRIGLHSGVADVGNFGSSERVDYTALGENINLASRMEGLNKHLGTQVLITGETQRLIGDKYSVRPLGKFVLKGFERLVDVFELSGRRDQAELFAKRDQPFGRALEQFQKGEFQKARQAFQAILAANPDDGPSLFFLRKCDEYLEKSPGVFWQGEVELLEK